MSAGIGSAATGAQVAPRFRVAICGGGLGGLTLAATLARHCSDIQCDVYEASSWISTAGAGIGTWQRTWRILERLGLDQGLVEKAFSPPKPGKHTALTLRRSDISDGGFNFYDLVAPYGMTPLHRADLFDALLRSLPETYTVHTSKRLSAYIMSEGEAGSVTLHFADGSTATADILVGADGVKSKTRAQMYADLENAACTDEHLGRYQDPKWSGIIAYRSVFPTAELLARFRGHPVAFGAVTHCGKGKSIMAYPIASGKMINVVAYVSDPSKEGMPFPRKWETPATSEEVLAEYEDWEPQALAIIKCMTQTSAWAIHVVDALPHYVHGSVALLGDAARHSLRYMCAHASTPYIGSGVGQAMEDAYILGRLLAHPATNYGNLAEALSVYEDARLPVANAVVQRARRAGRLYQFDLDEWYDGQRGPAERKQLDALSDQVYRQFEWIWGDGPDVAWEEAKNVWEARSCR
ncbi:FAD/NAD(P)-binding domain-containing protein [Punctularia strigosozonata HHB-11173 SS5]|uniref:FAD/NAD(P)-binding domain-containing protein n=1 Tax=Punctularia strigosozonata (strain HHB-11173) TaxID=741275 RepID=R7S139_PUNST|nr:FAD/NAD(P)-binding domain-containing protein [Punctularia strigosozonata HHB-11173 SS5]EIN03564.1 FAD/NAD(P)-binding domain-containing protein [Punctularia strigosozonata HHB-11173 SS5]